MPASPSDDRRNERRRVRLVIKLYGAGYTVEEIGRKTVLTPANVRSILRTVGISERQTTRERRKGR